MRYFCGLLVLARVEGNVHADKDVSPLFGLQLGVFVKSDGFLVDYAAPVNCLQLQLLPLEEGLFGFGVGVRVNSEKRVDFGQVLLDSGDFGERVVVVGGEEDVFDAVLEFDERSILLIIH